MFQDGIVDGQVGIARIVLGHVLQLLLVGVVRVLKLQVTQHAGEDILEAQRQVSAVSDKHARIPVELATLHEHLGKTALGFLGKRLDAEHIGLTAQVTQLDISIARLWSRRFHAHHQ